MNIITIIIIIKKLITRHTVVNVAFFSLFAYKVGSLR